MTVFLSHMITYLYSECSVTLVTIYYYRMSKLDIQQYLEKIYNVPVLSVRTQIVKRYIEANITKGECIVLNWSIFNLSML